jgi:UDPglucose 6-dehydrogenase
MHIAVIGTGYVGLVTGAVFAELGHRVIGVDIDAARVARLQRAEVPFFEPGLDVLVAQHQAAGRLCFTTDTAAAVREASLIVLAVGTPPAADGSSDLSHIDNAVRAVARAAEGYHLVVNKSTVPVGTGARVRALLAEYAQPGATFDVLSNPEFLREGSAVQDALHPDRVVIGADSAAVAAPLVALYTPLGCPIIVTDIASAEIIKYAANAYLATRLSFINAIADLCEAAGGDITRVAEGIGADPRIGRHFLQAGIGFGGSCFPKDISALIAIFQYAGCDPRLIEAVRDVNRTRVPRLLARMDALLDGLAGKTVAVLGLTFKPNTDDLRESKALELCRALLAAGAAVRAHDPIALDSALDIVPGFHPSATPLDATAGADAVVLATEWPDYRALDLAALRAAMRGTLLVDGRNLYDPAQAAAAGLHYLGIGRGTAEASEVIG